MEDGERKLKRHKPAAQGEAGQTAMATSQPESLPLPKGIDGGVWRLTGPCDDPTCAQP